MTRSRSRSWTAWPTSWSRWAAAIIRRLGLVRRAPEVVLAGGVFLARDKRFEGRIRDGIEAVARGSDGAPRERAPVLGVALLGLDRLRATGADVALGRRADPRRVDRLDGTHGHLRAAARARGGLQGRTGRQTLHPSRVNTSPKGGADSLWRPDRRALTVGLILTITLVAFEALAVSTVMPIAANELGGLGLYGWVFSAFFLGSLIGIVVVGDLIDRRGLALPFAVGLGLFGTGLLIGGLAPAMPVLVGARFIQGLGAGTIQPIAYVAIARSLPDTLRPRMFATLSTAWIVPGLVGPVIAGTVGQVLGWRYVFLGLLPLIAVAGALTLGALRDVPAAPPREDPTKRGRLPLAIAVAFGAALINLGLTTGIPATLVGLTGVGLVIVFVALRRLTPAGTLRARPILPAAVLLAAILTFAFFSVDAFVALALVEVRGISPAEAGLALTAATVTWTGGAWVQARGAAAGRRTVSCGPVSWSRPSGWRASCWC